MEREGGEGAIEGRRVRQISLRRGDKGVVKRERCHDFEESLKIDLPVSMQT